MQHKPPLYTRIVFNSRGHLHSGRAKTHGAARVVKKWRERCESPQIPRLHSMINCRNWMWKCIHGAAMTMAGRITKLQAVINFLRQLHFNGITFVVFLRVCGSSPRLISNYKSIDPADNNTNNNSKYKMEPKQKHSHAVLLVCNAFALSQL